LINFGLSINATVLGSKNAPEGNVGEKVDEKVEGKAEENVEGKGEEEKATATEEVKVTE
jgi:hypothetical protein